MAYAGLDMFMDKLKHLIHGNHDTLINNHPTIISERPQFQLLYQELIQTLFHVQQLHHHHHHHHHPDELEKVGNLKKRFKDAAEEAQDIIDLFLSAFHFSNRGFASKSHDAYKTSRFIYTRPFRNRGLSPISHAFKTSLELENVMRSIESIKVESMTFNINIVNMDSLKTDSADGTTTSGTRNPLEMKKPLMNDIIVGLDRDVELIRDKLTEDTKQLSVVSIVGMGGLGKTTLATKVFNDPFIVYHFHVRAWATVSQTYEKRDLLIQILVSMGVQQNFAKDKDFKLREKLHKNLMGRRYLIVIDDIWSVEAWDDLISFFPHENTGSRVLLTSRLNEVVLHMKSHGFVHSLPYLTKEESWELLREKVFHGNECPEWSIKPGMQIAKKCHGLPLSVAVMAGILAKESMSKALWENISYSIGSYIVKGNLETLALSYHHLPDHLRECFLYLGGFPEDFTFVVERLIWLWVAEGFIEEAGNRSLEDTAKAYLMDLIDRNLVIVAKRNSIGDVKACKLHDLVRELCVQKAKEERFFLKINSPPLYKQRRLFTNEDIKVEDYTYFPTPTIRSLLFSHTGWDSHVIKSIPHCFVLLRVLDLQKCELRDCSEVLTLLVHLRYLAIRYSFELPNSIWKLWSLQTLILKNVISTGIGIGIDMQLPREITDLVNLRHLWSNRLICLPYIGKPMNLLSISNAEFSEGAHSFQQCFPNIKKLALNNYRENGDYHFGLLPYLEILKLMGPLVLYDHMSFPATLKKLTLVGCMRPWSDMSIIQALPNLEVLKLKVDAFMGKQWDASKQQFRQLKLLTLERLDIEHWEVSRTSFPCLKRLALRNCKYLEEIPLEIGEIATLELIETDSKSNSVVESVKRIQQEQHDEGNYELKITIDEMELPFYLSVHQGSESE